MMAQRIQQDSEILEKLGLKIKTTKKNPLKAQDKNNEEKSPESYFEYARRKYFGDKLSQRTPSEYYNKKYPYHRENESRTGMKSVQI